MTGSTGMILFRFLAEFRYLPRPIPIFYLIFRFGFNSTTGLCCAGV
jgi:hypothetical protein